MVGEHTNTTATLLTRAIHGGRLGGAQRNSVGASPSAPRYTFSPTNTSTVARSTDFQVAVPILALVSPR